MWREGALGAVGRKQDCHCPLLTGLTREVIERLSERGLVAVAGLEVRPPRPQFAIELERANLNPLAERRPAVGETLEVQPGRFESRATAGRVGGIHAAADIERDQQ